MLAKRCEYWHRDYEPPACGMNATGDWLCPYSGDGRRCKDSPDYEDTSARSIEGYDILIEKVATLFEPEASEADDGTV